MLVWPRFRADPNPVAQAGTSVADVLDARRDLAGRQRRAGALEFLLHDLRVTGAGTG